MSIHIGAKPGEIAETVLMPGDPYRAKWAAETFLKDVVCINQVRGMLGYTGTWNGHRVTIQGSGMGMPSLSIYANELIRDYGAKSLIRIGSAGAMQHHVKVRDIVIAMTASTISTPSRGFFRELSFAPCADFGLLEKAVAAARAKGTPTHVGGIYSADVFYDERPDLNEMMTRHGVLAVEMEAAELYTVAARHGIRALAVLTVSDHLLTHEALPSEDRERSFGDLTPQALHPLQIAREHVDLEVDPLAFAQRTKSRHFAGMRDYVHAETASAVRQIFHLVHRQRDAIDGDRTLGRKVGRERLGRIESETARIARWRNAGDRGDAIDMAGDDMTAQLVAKLQSGFEIEARAFGPTAGNGARHGLGRSIDREPGIARRAALVDHGEAAARTGDRCAHGDGRRIEGACDDKAKVALLPHFADRADGGDYAGKHGVLR